MGVFVYFTHCDSQAFNVIMSLLVAAGMWGLKPSYYWAQGMT